MIRLIDKSTLVAEIERRKEEEVSYDENSKSFASYADQIHYSALDSIQGFINTLEVKEVDLDLIVSWFDHIAQIADDRKTVNGAVMEDWAALDEIKCLAKNSSEFIRMHYKAQKGE